jgi:hypothetical protein
MGGPALVTTVRGALEAMEVHHLAGRTESFALPSWPSQLAFIGATPYLE